MPKSAPAPISGRMRSGTRCASMIRVVGVAGANTLSSATVNSGTIPFQSAGSSTIVPPRVVRTQDLLANPAARLGGYQVRFATYF